MVADNRRASATKHDRERSGDWQQVLDVIVREYGRLTPEAG